MGKGYFMYHFLLIDLDDTILDFKAAEHRALRLTLEAFGLTPTAEVCARYSVINQRHWQMLERKELTRDQVLVGRFRVLFDEYGIAADPAATARCYAEFLSQGHFFLPGAEEALARLSEKYPLYIVSNGTASVQKGRLASANIGRYFREIFISQEIGVNKPDREFFTRCFARIPDFDPARALIVGDSLTSDIQGGINAGIATCWVNPTGKPAPAHIQPTYQIPTLAHLEALLESL